MHTRRYHHQQRSGNAAYRPIKSLLLNFILCFENNLRYSLGHWFQRPDSDISGENTECSANEGTGNVFSQTMLTKHEHSGDGRQRGPGGTQQQTYWARHWTSTKQMASLCPQRWYALKKRAREWSINWTETGVRGYKTIILIWVLLNVCHTYNRKVTWLSWTICECCAAYSHRNSAEHLSTISNPINSKATYIHVTQWYANILQCKKSVNTTQKVVVNKRTWINVLDLFWC